MNIVVLILTILLGSFQFEESASNKDNVDEKICITPERIIRPIRSWKILKTKITHKNKGLLLEISAHNPLNDKNPDSSDVMLILDIGSDMPFLVKSSEIQKYNLITAIYYNSKENVTFKRIYSIQNVKIKNKLKKISVQTPCFSREIVPVIKFEQEIIKAPEDGGTNKEIK